MKLPPNIQFPDYDEIKNNDWKSLREFLEDLIKVLEEQHQQIYEDLKQLQP